jgi:hypothetical protein
MSEAADPIEEKPGKRLIANYLNCVEPGKIKKVELISCLLCLLLRKANSTPSPIRPCLRAVGFTGRTVSSVVKQYGQKVISINKYITSNNH